MKIDRFALRSGGGYAQLHIEKDSNGALIRYEDHKQIIEDLYEDHKQIIEDLVKAAEMLINDVKSRYPNEELRCPYMIALDNALLGIAE